MKSIRTISNKDFKSSFKVLTILKPKNKILELAFEKKIIQSGKKVHGVGSIFKQKKIELENISRKILSEIIWKITVWCLAFGLHIKMAKCIYLNGWNVW